MAEVYVYHSKKPGFVGNRLRPLNALKKELPEVYSREVKKYEGREWLLDVTIPGLNCLWNDVIHFSLLHPKLIYRTLSEVGFEHHKISRDWFIVPLKDVMRSPAALYKNTRNDRSSRVDSPLDYEPVTEERVIELSGMPARNLAYYKECFEQKTYPLLWGFAPHVLLNGELDVSGYGTLNWQDEPV
jgi:hypothetical protein